MIVWLSCRLVELLEKREDNGGDWQEQKTKRGRDEGALLTPSGQIFIDEVHYCCTTAARAGLLVTSLVDDIMRLY